MLTVAAPFYEKITQGARCSHCRGPYLTIREHFSDSEYRRRLAFTSVCLNCHLIRGYDDIDVPNIIKVVGEPAGRVAVDSPYCSRQ